MVAKEIAKGRNDGLFAATPSLLVFKLLLSELSSQSQEGPNDWRLLWIELPEEDREDG